MSIRLLLLSAFAILLLMGCKPSRPAGIIGPGEMEDILVDYHLAQGMAESTSDSRESTNFRFIQAVFRKHGVTEAEFDSSMVYYSSDAKQLADIYNNVTARVDAEAQRLGLESNRVEDQFANITDQGDTANIWVGKNFAMLKPDRLNGSYHFERTADSTFREGDAFIWRISTQEVAKAYMSEAYAQLVIYYETDTVGISSQTLHGTGMSSLTYHPIERLDTVPIRSVAGYIFLPLSTQQETTQQVMLLNNMSLIRIHKERKEEPVDTLTVDSLQADTLQADSLQADTLPLQPRQRLSPSQLRDNQPREHRINVIKENPNPIRRQRGGLNGNRRKISN